MSIGRVTPNREPIAGDGESSLPDRSAAIEQVLARFGEVARRAGASHGLQGQDLDEVLQEVRIRLWRVDASESGKLDALKSSYVYRAALSAAIDLLRRRRARREESLEDEGAVDRDPPLSFAAPASADADVLASDAGRAIDAALSLVVASRRAVVRMYLAGYDRQEIAALLGWSEAKTRNLLYRGLDDLRQLLTAKGIHP
jgi:RNA polymerase sigma factor (sigma-70 family)